LWAEWHRGTRLCGCGQLLRECPVWTSILDELHAPRVAEEIERLAGHLEIIKTRHLPLLRSNITARRAAKRLGPYITELGSLYREIGLGTGARVIVDSSKFPTYGWLVDQSSQVELYVLHLVRDPRAVAYSWWRREKAESGRNVALPVTRERPLVSSLRWVIWNRFAEMTWGGSPTRYVRIRYEDFIRQPESTVRSVAGWVGEESPDLGFMDGDLVDLSAGHTIAGNPDRFRVGHVRLHLDDEWRSKLPPAEHLAVTTVTGPWLKHYGYDRSEAASDIARPTDTASS
jgi:hypothetical protein